jgi:hypothetical protein
MNFEFSRQMFWRILKYQTSWKYVQWESTDGETDMTKLTVVLSNFANAPKNVTPVYEILRP